MRTAEEEEVKWKEKGTQMLMERTKQMPPVLLKINLLAKMMLKK